MKKLSVFGPAMALAVALGALPLASAHADRVAEEMARTAYENARIKCASLSTAQAQDQCIKQAAEDYKADMQAAKEK